MARDFGRRMGKAWTLIPGSTIAMTASATAVGSNVGFNIPGTILRMLGEWSAVATPGGTFGTGDKAEITVGLGVFNADAVALGATAMPEPLDQADYPWLYWKSIIVTVPDSSLTGNEIPAFKTRQFDSRTMRRVKPQETLSWVAQYTDIAGAPPTTVDFPTVRVLVGQH